MLEIFSSFSNTSAKLGFINLQKECYEFPVFPCLEKVITMLSKDQENLLIIMPIKAIFSPQVTYGVALEGVLSLCMKVLRFVHNEKVTLR